TGATNTDRFITRRYDGIQSVDDMARLNRATSLEADKFIKLKKPIRILLDLRGNYATTSAIYAEAIKFLNLYEIDRIAIVQPVDLKLELLTQNTKDTYQHFIEYRKFDSESAAQKWLEEA